MQVINLFGSPGSGKSTTAAGLFYLMKLNGFKVELVTEFVKDLIWEDNLSLLKEQMYILAKQNHKLERLNSKVDYVITDSPLLLSSFYTPENYLPSFKSLVLEQFNKYDNTNIFLIRNHPYQDFGRIHTEEESYQIHDNLKSHLYNNNIDYIKFDADPKTPNHILQWMFSDRELLLL